MIKLKISVTKEILKKSKYCSTLFNLGPSSENCAIALAVRDIFPNAIVGIKDMFFGVDVVESPISLPIVARRFIAEFDSSSPDLRIKMNPVSFEITVPNYVIDKINIDELRPLLVNHPTLELV
jgi:hypothetical protein